MKKLIVSHLVKNSPPFLKPSGALLCSQDPTVGPYFLK